MFQWAERSTGQAHEIQGERANKWWGRCGRNSGRGIRQRPSSVPVYAGLFADNALGGRYRALRRRRRRDIPPRRYRPPRWTPRLRQQRAGWTRGPRER
ncbi:unnamed protein product [Ectocarpus sp. 12 AP-2014]